MWSGTVSYLLLWRPPPPLFRLLLREPALAAAAAGASVDAEPEAAEDLEPARDDIVDLSKASATTSSSLSASLMFLQTISARSVKV